MKAPLSWLKDYVDIWLPDLKYYDATLAKRYSKAADYFSVASQAILQMISQTGTPAFHKEENLLLMDRGVIIRHLVLPGQKEDSIRLLHWIAECLPKDHYFISLLSQYTPIHKNSPHPELNRTVTSYEYKKVADTALSLGLDQGYIQKKSSAREEYTPLFHCQGLSPQEYGKKI